MCIRDSVDGVYDADPKGSGGEKARLIREIIDYEDSHGQCTQTFTKKIRKQFRPRTA